MRTSAAFLAGCGIGAAAVNMTLVSYGENRGYFFGAALVMLAVVFNLRSTSEKKGALN